MKHTLASAFIAATCASMAQGANIDFSSWNETLLDFPGGQGNANWTLTDGNTTVIQQNNSDPSFFINPDNQTSFTLDGSWRVNTFGDDDYMGFVFGYQNSSNFYLFDWKQGSQGYDGAYANEGMTIKKFEGATGNGLVDLSLGELWENDSDLGDMTILDQNHGSDKGWVENTLYDFSLDFNTTPGEFSIEVLQEGVSLWDTTVEDSAFTSGHFGFYNYSQSDVEYAGFTETIVPQPDPGEPPVNGPVPAPDAGTTAAMLGLSLAGAAALRRRLASAE